MSASAEQSLPSEEQGMTTAEEALAAVGGNHIAYVRPVRCEEAAALYPRMPYLSHWFTLFALHAADGQLLALVESREDAVKDAINRKLVPVGLH
jgi:hypothetical protein